MIEVIINAPISILILAMIAPLLWLGFDLNSRVNYTLLKTNHEQILKMFLMEKHQVLEANRRVVFMNSRNLALYADAVNVGRRELKSLIKIMDDACEASDLTLVMI